MLDLLYALTFIIPAPFWLLMLFAPRQGFTRRVLNSYLAFLLLGALYVFTLVGATITLLGSGGLNFSSLSSLAAMLASPAAALVLWMHVVTLDLVGGQWIFNEAEKMQMHVITLRVFLIFTLLVGPFGIFGFVLWRLLTNSTRSAATTGTGSPQAVARQ
jgi:hypothetical protein